MKDDFSLLFRQPVNQAAALTKTHFALSRSSWRAFSKRAIDMVGAFVLILFFLPFMLVVAIALLIADGRPVLYSHTRVGRRGVPFGCLKFRTMYRSGDRLLQERLDADPAARAEWLAKRKLKDDPRVHAAGRFLRRTSLDELPQLFNVLVGQMSLVGPRPVIQAEMKEYGRRAGCYLALRPGMTGLWQVSGRSNTSYRERVDLDERYSEEQSMLLDMSILLRTLQVVVVGRGAY